MGLFSRKDELEQLREEMRGYGSAPNPTRSDLLMGSRTALCRYHPDNGGTGRKPGDPRHFSDYIEDVLDQR